MDVNEMNEAQHDAKVRRDERAAHVGLLRDELTHAVRALKVAEEELQRVVDADKPSWY